METSVKILTGISDEQKGAYLAGIASIATADSQASQQELDHLSHLCDAADLPAEQRQIVLNAAADPTNGGLVNTLDSLKGSDLKYSFLTDLLAFAKSDGNYGETEHQSIQKIANYLGVDETQFGLLGQVAEQANASSGISYGEQMSDSGGILSSLGDKLKSSGIDGGGLLKGLVSIAAPFIISKMMNKNTAGATSGGGGGLSDLLGGNTGGGGGGLSGLLGGGGGLGNLFNMISGGKGMGGATSLIGKLFG